MSSSSSSDVIESYPPGFNANPSAPSIIILDHKFRVKYKWEHPQISDNPIQDFNLLSHGIFLLELIRMWVRLQLPYKIMTLN